MTVNQLKPKIAAAIEKCQRLDQVWATGTNPQIVAMRNQNKGRLDAYQAVMDALNGDTVLLNIDSQQ